MPLSHNLLFEKYVQKHNLFPEKRFQYKDMEVYLADGVILPSEYDHMNDLKKEFPLGFYETVYAIGKDEDILAFQPLLFDYLHDIKTLTTQGRKQGRLNAAIRMAKDFINAQKH